MEPRRFDTLARALATRSSRRLALRRLGLGGVLAAGATLLRSSSSVAQACTYAGCGCSGGVLGACGGGLVCCPSNPGLPGGAGVCAPAGQCGGACVDQGDACPAYCNWGDACPDCCSGFCGQFGACAQQSCTAAGCSCPTGTLDPCDPGLSCCSLGTGLFGGPGVCQISCD